MLAYFISKRTMAITVLSFLGFLAVSRAALLPQFDSRIVGGVDAKLGDIPWQAFIQLPMNLSCGGSVLNDKYVLTAAHCLGFSEKETIVMAGIVYLKEPTTFHYPEKFIIHENYEPYGSHRNDIGLIKVKQPFVESKHLKYVSLPSKNEIINPGDMAVVSGWGKLWFNGPASNTLKKVKLFIIDQDTCNRFYGGGIYATHICANRPPENKGACQGDSGGPMTVNGKLVGIVSWGIDCGKWYYPDVDTRVTSYLDWIRDNAV